MEYFRKKEYLRIVAVIGAVIFDEIMAASKY